MRAAPALAALALAAGCAGTPGPDGPAVVWSARSPGPDALAAFDFSDPAAFEWSDEHGGAIALARPATYEPPHRSPHAIALLEGLELRSFELECDLLQTGREYGHRDLCLVFGFQAPDRFYYAHLATAPDANAHNVFLVDGAPRRNLLPPRERGVDWGTEQWHHVVLARDVDAGTIRVWFDDLSAPVLEARDATLDWGRVGFGSFDDTGMLRNLVIRSDEARAIDTAGSPFTGG